MHVTVVVGGARLVGRGAARAALVDRELAPVGVDLGLGVAGQDVGDDVGGLRADDVDAFRLLVAERPDLASVLVDDLGDQLAGHPHAAVGDRAVRRQHVDGVRLERADAHRGDRCGARQVAQAEVLRPVERVLEALDDGRLDGRDVERELECAAQPDGTPFELVRLGRGVAAPEVGHDVHEHRARGQGLVIDADGVVDGLDRRAGLAPAGGQDVVLGLELLGALGRVAGAADVGEHLAGPVVQYRGRCVVDVPAAQVEDPALLAGRDLARFQDAPGVARLGRPGRDIDPLLGGLLHVPVERRGDPIAAGIDFGAVGRMVGTDDVDESLADLPHELGRPPCRRRVGADDDGLGLGRLVLLLGVARAAQRRAGLHQVEDVVAPGDDVGACGDLQLDVLAVGVVGGGGRVDADLLGVAHQVELGR